ncbi:hypothetical protein BFP72_10095 [Reichenbachiella sp. 5M10]|nr:hypothetical protein BFP72_10095 [Reichenbachiella sp. 5M10]
MGMLCMAVFAQAQKKSNEVELYFLGGQSNMEGYGYVKDLPDSLNKAQDGIYIFHGHTVADDEVGGGVGSWQVLQPGHGTGFAADMKKNKYSDRFGLELSFAMTMQEAKPGKRIALIKYSRGGTSIDTLANEWGCWDPDYHGKKGINQYDHFLATMRHAMADHDIDGDGVEDILIPKGILWMQGESDGKVESASLKYYDNLKRLMGLIRATMWADDMPVVIGKISDSGNEGYNGKVWKYGELVQYGQEKFVREDDHAAIVRETKRYKYSDPWHYQSANYIQLGNAFAAEMLKLEE